MKSSIIASLTSRQDGIGSIKTKIRFDILAEVGNGITFPCYKGCMAKIGHDGRIMEVNVSQRSFVGDDGEDHWTDVVKLTPPEQFALYQIFAATYEQCSASVDKLPIYVPKAKKVTELLTAKPEAPKTGAAALKAKVNAKATGIDLTANNG
jgi:hypothetical protein